jgi:hypothetical protein
MVPQQDLGTISDELVEEILTADVAIDAACGRMER